MTSSPIPSRGAPTLLPCPFCGGEDVVSEGFNIFSVRCRSCGASTAPRERGVYAEANWNTRALFPVEAANGSGWRPIETAPKDGTWVDAWRPAPSFTGPRWEPRVTVQWNDDEAAWVWPDGYYEVFTVRGRELAEMKLIEEEYYADADRFTHWQPLPSPPLTEGQDGKGADHADPS